MADERKGQSGGSVRVEGGMDGRAGGEAVRLQGRVSVLGLAAGA